MRLRQSPGNYFFQSNLRRWLYKLAAQAFCHERIAASRHLLSALPGTDHSIGARGYLVLPPTSDSRLRAVESSTQLAAQRGVEVDYSTDGNGFLRSILMPPDLLEKPDILRYGLSDELIVPIAHYLGQVPVLPYIFVWRSLPSGAAQNKGSQLWHLDHSDTYQVKVFVFLDDITADNGPLCLIPAPRSQQVRRKLRYNWHNRRRISDADMYRLIDPDTDVVSITGRKGSAVFVDTSRCFHYGSRLQSGMRHILLYRFMTYTSFITNPFQRPPRYPLAPFAQLPALSPLQKTVLTGMPNHEHITRQS